MSGIISALRVTAGILRKRIMLPECNDPRVLKAAERLAETGWAAPVLLELPKGISEAPPGVDVFSLRDDADDWFERAVTSYAGVRAAKGLTLHEARNQLTQDTLLLAAVLLSLGFADGAVAGSLASTADVLRAGIRGLGKSPNARQVSSFFLMELSDGRVLSYGDCAVIPEPNSEMLADIAIATAASHERLTGLKAKVALLSFSTKGSAVHKKTEKVCAALRIARERNPSLMIDGELQFDAAFLPAIAQQKAPDSNVAGHANVYIFPDLDAGNIAYKITQRIGGAKAIGPVVQGLSKPWMDLSRGCSVDDIIDLSVVAAVLAGDGAGV